MSGCMQIMSSLMYLWRLEGNVFSLSFLFWFTIRRAQAITASHTESQSIEYAMSLNKNWQLQCKIWHLSRRFFAICSSFSSCQAGKINSVSSSFSSCISMIFKHSTGDSMNMNTSRESIVSRLPLTLLKPFSAGEATLMACLLFVWLEATTLFFDPKAATFCFGTSAGCDSQSGIATSAYSSGLQSSFEVQLCLVMIWCMRDARNTFLCRWGCGGFWILLTPLTACCCPLCILLRLFGFF